MSAAWCVFGDLNSIRRLGERKSVISNQVYRGETRRFNDFIEKSDLFNIPMVGRKFTWYKPNGLVKSIIDRIIVSREWLDRWPDSKKVVLGRSVSDHCTLVLKTSWIGDLNRLEVWIYGNLMAGLRTLFSVNGRAMRCMVVGFSSLRKN